MDPKTLLEQFEIVRPQLQAVADRLTGNRPDAEDALQSAWIKAQTAQPTDIERPIAWLTTIVSREALDILRRRRRRAEDVLPEVVTEIDTVAVPEDDTVWVESVGRALLVLLDRLTPAQRAAFVLHDLFAVPFEEIGEVLDRSPVAAKKLASRARTLVAPPHGDRYQQPVESAVVSAYLAASAAGDMDALLRILAPDVVRRADPSLVPAGVPAVVHGPSAVAEQTRRFADRARVSAVVMIDGVAAIVVAPNARPVAVMTFVVRSGLIHEMRVVPAEELAHHDWGVVAALTT